MTNRDSPSDGYRRFTEDLNVSVSYGSNRSSKLIFFSKIVCVFFFKLIVISLGN